MWKVPECREGLAALRGEMAARNPAGGDPHWVVIVAGGKGWRAESALQLFEEVLLQGLQPQVTSYAAATSACRKGRITERALQLLRRCGGEDTGRR